MKIRLLFKHHCIAKVKKTCPRSHLDLREMLQCIRARGLFQEKNEEIMNKEWEAQK